MRSRLTSMSRSWTMNGLPADQVMQATERTVIGKIPSKATHWSVRREVSPGSWEWQQLADEHGIAVKDFPMRDLSIKGIQQRWGAGRYRVMYLEMRDGMRRVQGNGRIFELTEPGAKASSPRPTRSSRRKPRIADAAAEGQHARLRQLTEMIADGLERKAPTHPSPETARFLAKTVRELWTDPDGSLTTLALVGPAFLYMDLVDDYRRATAAHDDLLAKHEKLDAEFKALASTVTALQSRLDAVQDGEHRPKRADGTPPEALDVVVATLSRIEAKLAPSEPARPRREAKKRPSASGRGKSRKGTS